MSGDAVLATKQTLCSPTPPPPQKKKAERINDYYRSQELIGIRTSCLPIRSVIILLQLNNSDSRTGDSQPDSRILL